MAKVELDVMYRSVRGRIGNFVHYNSYDRQLLRVYVIPQNPDTDRQKFVRKTFGDAVRSWQVLTPDEKQKYNRKARRLKISGYNLYISDYMKETIKLRRENPGLFIPSCKLPYKGLIPSSSVSTTYLKADGSSSASTQAEQS